MLKSHGKRIIYFIIALILCNSYLPVVAAFAGYQDVPQEHWASEYIRQLGKLGYSQGAANGDYKPEKLVTNAEFAAFVCRMTGMDDTVLDRGAHWADAVMEYAKHMGWFTPGEIPGAQYDEPINREMAVKILMLSSFGDPGAESLEEGELSDLSDVGEGYHEYVTRAYLMGIITGYPDGTFRPKDNITRAETAAIICRAISLHFNAPEVGESVTVPILLYHHISDRPGDITLQKFREDMENLAKAGYTAVFLEDLQIFIEEGTQLPEKPVVITFDDGYLSNYQYAWPVLKELGMKGDIAVIGWSAGLDRDKDDQEIIPHFSWEQASEMVSSGAIRIHPHSYDMHEFSSDADVSRVGVLRRPDESYGEYIAAFVEDLKKVGSMIRLKLGYSSNVFVYPYGESSPMTEKLLESFGYDITLGTKDGLNVVTEGDKSSLRLMKRINADGYEGDIVRLIETYN